MKSIRYGLPVSVALAALLMAGCSGADSSTETTSASETSQGAAETPAATGTIAGGELAAKMTTALQEAKTFKLSMETGGTQMTGGEVAYNGDKASMHSTVAAMGQGIEMIAIDNATELYIKAPSLQIPTWTKVEASNSNPIVQQVAQQLANDKSNVDPAAGLKLYEQAGDFTAEGSETVDGVETTKYSGTIPVSAMKDMLGGMANMPTDDMEPVAVQVFVDKDYRPIRIDQRVTVGGQATDVTVKYSDYGTPITVTAPEVGS